MRGEGEATATSGAPLVSGVVVVDDQVELAAETRPIDS